MLTQQFSTNTRVWNEFNIWFTWNVNSSVSLFWFVRNEFKTVIWCVVCRTLLLLLATLYVCFSFGYVMNASLRFQPIRKMLITFQDMCIFIHFITCKLRIFVFLSTKEFIEKENFTKRSKGNKFIASSFKVK